MTDYNDIRFRKYPFPDGEDDWFITTEECQLAGASIIIPQGYVTDFASIPRIFWTIFSPYGRNTNPSILHDYCYTSKVMSNLVGDQEGRKLADELFYNNMLAEGVPKLGAKIMFLAVRYFGKGHYGKNERSIRVINKTI